MSRLPRYLVFQPDISRYSYLSKRRTRHEHQELPRGQVSSLKRAGIRASRRPRWHPAFLLIAAAAVPCLVAACAGSHKTGPGSGTLTGIVTRCTSAEFKAGGWAADHSRVVTVSVQNLSVTTTDPCGIAPRAHDGT